MRRRRFLQALTGLLGGTASGLFSRDATASADAPHVVVVGAGPAGLSAALELAERGVRVTLVEAADTVGGKVVGWEETLQGEKVDVEHGIHGWWPQYVHFIDLMERYNLTDALRPWGPNDNGLFTKNMVVKRFRDQANAYIDAARTQGYKNFPRHYRRGLRWVHSLPRRPERLSVLQGQTLADWAATKPPLTITTTFDRMVAWSMYFVAPDQVDAAVAMEGEWFYWSGSALADQVSWLNGNPQTLVFNPLADAFVGLGGTLDLGQPVSSLIVEDGAVVGVRVGSAAAVTTVTAPIESWRREGMVLLGPGEDGIPTAYSARCTHMGCPVDVAPTGFACPCHGGQYDLSGTPTGGPPEHPLQRLVVEPSGEGFAVSDPTAQREIRADAVILALDVPALKALAADLLPGVEGLRATREVVARFWFDQDVAPDYRPASLVDDYPHTSNLFLVHRIQASSARWAAATGGSVIEVQAYRDLPELTGEALLDVLEAELRTLLPELEGAQTLKRTLTDGSTFTWFAPDWHEHALGVDPGVKGLFLAGDHLKIDRMCQFMERAVFTGRLAANHVLANLDLPTAPVLPFR